MGDYFVVFSVNPDTSRFLTRRRPTKQRTNERNANEQKMVQVTEVRMNLT